MLECRLDLWIERKTVNHRQKFGELIHLKESILSMQILPCHPSVTD